MWGRLNPELVLASECAEVVGSRQEEGEGQIGENQCDNPNTSRDSLSLGCPRIGLRRAATSCVQAPSLVVVEVSPHPAARNMGMMGVMTLDVTCAVSPLEDGGMGIHDPPGPPRDGAAGRRIGSIGEGHVWYHVRTSNIVYGGEL